MGDLKKHGFTYANLTFLKRGSNLCAYRLVKNSAESDDIGLEICSSHFIERYNQRFLRKPELSHKQAFVEFYKRNPICNILPLPSEVHDFNHMAACSDGFCFEKMENDTINVLRTFISHDMLKGSQYDTADLAVETVRASLAGIISNMSSCEEELDRVCNGEQKIPTMDDYNYCMKLCDQLREKKLSLEKEGKLTDLEYAEMRNRLTIYIAGFDWGAAMLKDENGQLVRHPLDFY